MLASVSASVSATAPPPCAPCIVHWHLRKCAGTSIRRAFTLPSVGGGRAAISRYTEVHGDHRTFAGQVRRVRKRCCAVRTLVVLREPYDQLVSEMDFFPGDFALARNRLSGSTEGLPGPWWSAPPYFQTRDDHFVCEHGALMGLCECATQRRRRQPCSRERCNATSVVARLRELDHVGFVESMRCTYSTLARWVAEGGLSDARDAAVARALERRASRPDSARRTMNASARIARYYEILSDLPSPPPRRPPRQGTPQHLALLTHLPSRDEFDRHNGCANDVYAAAQRELAAACTS